MGVIAYGTLAHPSDARVICGYGVTRGTHGGHPLRLELWAPAVALDPLHPGVGTALDATTTVEAPEWWPAIEQWLVDLATHLHPRVPYRLARIGVALDPEPTADDLTADDGTAENHAPGVPAAQAATLLVPRRHGLVRHSVPS